MEPKWLMVVLFRGLTLFVVFGTRPMSAVDIQAPAEVVVENGTTGILKCFFKSKDMVSSETTVQWTIRKLGSDERSTIINLQECLENIVATQESKHVIK